jgi:hypothetical protein
VGGVGEIVKTGFNGFLLSPDPGNDEVLSVLEKFTKMNDEDYIRMRINAYETWKTKFNAHANAENLLMIMMEGDSQR